jgi:DNA-binding NarL/FixJ family response regulator
MSFDEASSVMIDLRGRQFEPRLLDAFFESMEEISAIREAFPDVEEDQKRIRVLVVDDHEIFAHSLVRLLDSRPELKVVGTAGSISAAVVAALAYVPDVILMDFELPDGDGPQATEQIKSVTPEASVIMLTARTDDRSLARAISAGCCGLVRKTEPVEVLFDAIVAAHEDDAISAPQDLTPVLRTLSPTRRRLGATLTSRETEILQLMTAGLVNKQIAERLGVRLNTVRNHVQSILYKVNAHSKLEAVANAVREGLIEYPETG